MAAVRSPAVAASALLHAGLIVAVVLGMRRAAPPPPPLTLGASTPVSIVSEAPAAEPTPTPAPAPVKAQAPEPAPTPPAPEPPAPTPPAPRPAPRAAPAPPRPAPPAPTPPPVPRPAPQAATPPRPAPPRPAPTPPRPTPAPRRPALDLDALSRSLPQRRPAEASLDLQQLARNLPRSAARPAAPSLDLDRLASSLPARAPAAAARGPARPAVAPPVRAGLSGDVAGALRAKVQPRWSLNCDLDGADTVVVKVRFSVDAAGALAGAPSTVSVTGEASEGAKAAFARGAEAAVRAAAPFTEVPPDQRRFMNPAILNFNAAQACRNR